MRDKRWEQCHQEEPKAVWFQQDPDEDEIQPLLFDLVRTNKVELMETLLPQVAKCKYEVKRALDYLIGGSGSTAMIDLFRSHDGKYYIPYLQLLAAICATNIENYRHMLLNSQTYFLKVRYPRILQEILKSKSEEFLLGWEICVYADFEAWKRSTSKNSCVPYGERYIGQGLLKTAMGHPGNDAFIMLLWKKLNLAKELGSKHLGDALGSVAATCCSVKLAKYLIDAGAAIDYRRSSKYLTPLHHAATKNSSEAAELMRYLLVLGADPAAFSTSPESKGSKIRRIRDEAGAKGISKWLGISWDDLVKKAKLENQKK